MKKSPPKALYILPNLFTVSSIFCGIYAILEAIGHNPGRFHRAALAIIFAVVFDSLDGRVARLTKTQSEFGVQLDSLADLVSFGVAPAVLIHQWALAPYGWAGTAVAFIYVTGGALRLARFNVMAAHAGGPSTNFIGLPIPLAAATLSSLVMLHQRAVGGPINGQPLVIALTIALALLMVSNVPYRTFKKLRADRRSLPVLITLAGGAVLTGILTSFSLLLVVITGGFISMGLAEGLYRLVHRHPGGSSHPIESPEDEEEENEEKPAT